MTALPKEDMEDLLRDVLRMQKDIRDFLKSRTEGPATLALAMATACNLILDEYEDDSEVFTTYSEMAPRLGAVVDLGHEAVLKTLEDGSYDRIFSVSVEIGALDSDDDCGCGGEYVEGDPILDEHDIN